MRLTLLGDVQVTISRQRGVNLMAICFHKHTTFNSSILAALVGMHFLVLLGIQYHVTKQTLNEILSNL